MAIKELWLLSFLVYGLLIDISKGQKAKYGISKWNQNEHKNRTTSEPRLGAFDRVNTTDVPEEFEPITNVRGVIINKPVPGQEMFNNVLNPGHVATNKVQWPQNQPQQRTTPEPHLGKFDRVNTTDVPEEFEPVTNYQGLVINKPVHGQEMYNDIMAPGHTSVNRSEGSQKSWNITPTQNQTTAEPLLGTFDRVNTTDVPKEFEPVTNSKRVVINKPVPGQEIHNDALRSAHGPMDMLLKQEATKLQAAEGVHKQVNRTARIATTSTKKGSNSKSQIKSHSVNRKSKQKSLKKQRLAEKEVEYEEKEKEEPQEEEQEQKKRKKSKI
ncbi:hypothetical protein CHS0354_031876 [Potamilus streckersoni]|uniref:Uncharacterized protein n=1 Tax=Potamilus streckersoni TaxID=2493646 RepID=A0AAE0VKR3_9BIVA|nr:hypothetical protein CHS0354_031876 [Potamilus streckersoni]